VWGRCRNVIDPHRRPEQLAFRSGRSTADGLAFLRGVAAVRERYQKNTFAAYIDFKDAFGSVDRVALFERLSSLGVARCDLCLLGLLYRETTSVVRCGSEESEPFTTLAGLRQGCVAAPPLFSTALDEVISDVAAAGSGVEVSVLDSRKVIVVFADDVVLLSESVEELQVVLDALIVSAARFGLVLNVGKSKLQTLSGQAPPNAVIAAGGRALEWVDEFRYLGSVVTRAGAYSQGLGIYSEMIDRKTRTIRACWRLSTLWNSGIPTRLKLRLYVSLVRSILLYGCESWTLSVEVERLIDACESICLRRVLGIRWEDHVSNERIRRDCGFERLSVVVARRQLRYFGHVMRDSSLPVHGLLKGYCSFRFPVGWRQRRGRQASMWPETLLGLLRGAAVTPMAAVGHARDRVKWRRLVERYDQ
jgi:hypothetical protein